MNQDLIRLQEEKFRKTSFQIQGGVMFFRIAILLAMNMSSFAGFFQYHPAVPNGPSFKLATSVISKTILQDLFIALSSSHSTVCGSKTTKQGQFEVHEVLEAQLDW